MPRNPGAKKHQHNNRHETGLVGPGKRIVKQKSNGHLNGAAKGFIPSDLPPAAASPACEPSVTGADTTDLPSKIVSDGRADTLRKPSQPGLTKRDSESSQDGPTPDHAAGWPSTNGSTMPAPRRSDMAPPKGKPTQDMTALQIAATILKSRPACDTIALLIVLLALPSMVLTIVQALFASLTLMPGAGLAPISFLSLFDVFQGSAGSPSLGTMAVVDVICFGLWICLWNWAQNFALDLAQTQIAITLGNGNAGKNGSINAICFMMVLFLHAIRSKAVRRFLVSNLVLPMDLLSHTRLADLATYLPADTDFGDSPGPPSKIRSLFAIHILSQAFMAFVRRRVANAQTPINPKSSSKRADTEASAGSSVAEASAVDAVSGGGTSSGIDYPPPTPSLKEGKDKGPSAKKRRRQANHVRSRQPFWAALASTKVHVLREVEHNKALPNGGPQTALSDATHPDLVWVTHVDPSSIQFEANYLPSADHDQEAALPGDCKPFYVRINGAKWHSVSLDRCDDGRPPNSLAQWTGEISGLAPNCTYTCSFNRGDDDQEFASVMVKTPPLQDKDVPLSLAPAPVRQPTRPSSPTTTLKSTISTAEAKLNEARSRLTKVRRQHKASLAKVEREVESFATRLKSSSDDTKQRQKLLQAERTIRQTEDATHEIEAALEDLASTPDDDTDDYNTRREAYEQQSKLLAEVNDTLSKAKAAASHDLSCVNNELNTITSRKERLTGRHAKLTEQHDRITQANAQGLNEKERRAAESAAKQTEQQRREAEISNQISYLENELRNARVRWEANCRELDALERQDLFQRQMLLKNGAGPLTPEGELPGTRPHPQPTRSFAFGTLQAVAPNSPIATDNSQGSPFLAYAKTLPSDHRRPRSETNRSAGGMSNFSADFEDADPIPPMPSTTEYDLNGRKGSGSSRGQNNASPAAGIIGSALRSPQRGNHSPGHLSGSTTW